jgi:flavin reductase (DIM6/NTAB) family NADH-FMN oxidoreductase RutF
MTQKLALFGAAATLAWLAMLPGTGRAQETNAGAKTDTSTTQLSDVIVTAKAHMAIAPAKSGTSWPMIRSSGHFCLNFLAAGQRSLCHRFAQSGQSKFEGLSWKMSTLGSPIIDGVLGFVDCRIDAEHEAGDHTIVLGEVFNLGILLPDPQPLLFYRGRFGSFDPGAA